jgi:hypothetical protein
MHIRALIAFLVTFIASVSGACAQPATCIDPTQSWAWSYNNDPIQAITYYLDTQILSVFYVSGIIHLASSVSIGAAQRFQKLGYGVSPDSTWNGMRGSYLEILQAQNHCPLLAQNGAFLLSAPSRQDVPNP